MEITNCVNCGAPLHGSACEYCGTEYNLKPANENSGKDGYEDVDVWTDCNGMLHRTSRKEILQEFNQNPW